MHGGRDAKTRVVVIGPGMVGRGAVDALVDQAKSLARVEDLFADGSEELLKDLRTFYDLRNDLYAAIGGCDELLVDVDEEVGDSGETEGDDE